MKVPVLNLSYFSEKNFQKTENSEKEIIEGILQNSNRVIAEIYKQNFGRIKRMVYTFRNTMLDPEDIFQEGLTRAILNIRAGKFRGDSSFYTYLSGICRNICLKQLAQGTFVEIQPNIPEEEEQTFEILDRLLQVKEQLDKKCQIIIDLRFSMNEDTKQEEPSKCLSFEDIAEHLQLSAVNARQRFKRCVDKLRELVFFDSELNEYFA